MKKYILMALVGLMTVMPASAQNYRNSRYYNPRNGRLDYSHRHSHRYTILEDSYFGFRVGGAFSTVSSDDPYLDGSSMKSGLNIGVATGFAMVPQYPLFFETGLYYTEKGGRGKVNGDRFTYTLDYLEMPLLFKYKYVIDRDIAIEPFLGGYLACGVGGKIKDFGGRTAYSSFSDNNNSFKRFDGGIRFGVGASFDIFNLELAYDLGLANVSNNDFDESRNRTLMLNVGINF